LVPFQKVSEGNNRFRDRGWTNLLGGNLLFLLRACTAGSQPLALCSDTLAPVEKVEDSRSCISCVGSAVAYWRHCSLDAWYSGPEGPRKRFKKAAVTSCSAMVMEDEANDLSRAHDFDLLRSANDLRRIDS